MAYLHNSMSHLTSINDVIEISSPGVRDGSTQPCRYTRDGDAALEHWLDKLCEQSSRGIQEIIPQPKLESLILGGGYGRGEGGVQRKETGDAPYNDLEFFVLIKGNPRWNERRFGARVHALGHHLTEESGLEVEFKITSLASIRKSETTMFYYDLVCGHQVTMGPANILHSCRHHRQAEAIPLHEATRLLMNRCSGLLFAKEHLKHNPFTEEDSDFVCRNIAKARLAMGDALLAANGRFRWSCLERQRRLHELSIDGLNAELDAITQAHNSGVEFKLHPTQSEASHSDLRILHDETAALAWKVWQWIEQKRLGISFDTPLQYASVATSLCPESNPLKNFLVRVATFGPSVAFNSDRFRYPREGLLRTLPLLLWESENTFNKHLAPAAQRWLRAPIPSRRAALEAYEKLWCRFN